VVRDDVDLGRLALDGDVLLELKSVNMVLKKEKEERRRGGDARQP
jgi:hypothetical protein